MQLRVPPLAALVILTLAPAAARGQDFPTDDPVVRTIWTEGMERSHAARLAQVLLDSVGPRLAGSPGFEAAAEWLLARYETWGVPARLEEYGTWTGWSHGALHVDLVAPRVQTLEAELLAYSPGTRGRAVEGEVVVPPPGLTDSTTMEWLETVDGTWVLFSPPEPMCRARQELEANARAETVERVDSLRIALQRDFLGRLQDLGRGWQARARALEEAGAAGIITSWWSGGWGVNKVSSSFTRRVPGIDVSCEDYGMLFRMAEAGQAPRIRVYAEAEDLGEVPQFNVIAEIRGSELPEEYVVLSAHLDSWHAATGATDNGTGTIVMLEAMRILKEAYPSPRRTILAGHWGAEEMGLIGSRAFVEDHPEVIEGLQVAFNQDNGTWRIERIEGQGFLEAGSSIARWMSRVPADISGHVQLVFPGPQENTASDHSSFVCMDAPAFRLQSSYDEYRQYTWHTNRDTYDKIVFDDLKENATLAAMLVYAAAEDPERVSRARASLPVDPRTGEPRRWMRCGTARRGPP